MKKIYTSIILLSLLNTLNASEMVGPTVEKQKALEKENKSFYVGSSINMDAYKDPNKIDSVSLLAGYKINDYLGLETRYITNLSNNNDLNIRDISLYLKPEYNLNNFKVYSLFGYGNLNLKNDLTKDKSDDYSFKWGVGMGYSLNEKLDVPFNIYLDYTDISEKENINIKDGTLNTVNFGFTYAF